MNAGLVLALIALVPCQPETPEARWKERHGSMVEAIRQGHYDSAASEGRQALAAAKEIDPSGPEAIETQIEVARVRWKEGHYGAADDALQEIRKRLDKAGKHPALEARTWNLHAEVLAELGQREMAGELASKAYKVRHKKFGAEHPETVESVDTLAHLGRAFDELHGENFVGRSNWSVEEMSLQVREKLLGKQHPGLAASHVAVARNRLHNGDAEKHLRQALKLWAKINPKHPELAATWTLLCRNLRLRGDMEEAEHAVQNALKLSRYHDDSGWLATAGHGLLELALLRGQQLKAAEADKLYREALEQHFFWTRDDDLCVYFAKIPFDRRGFGDDQTTLPSGEAYLHEMMRRGGPIIEKALAKRALELAKKIQPKVDRDYSRNLEVLTALRRLQKKVDPVKVEVKGAVQIEAIFPHVPDLEVALVNQDEKRASVGYIAGGDYRTGRLERWRLDVRDQNGKQLPAVNFEADFGGGLYHHAVLKPDKKWEATLSLWKYVQLPPGDYVLRVQYHDRDYIAGLHWIGGRIVCQSDEIRLQIQPRVIDVSDKEKKTIEDLIEKLDDKAGLRVIDGPYGKDHHRLIAPDSPAGRLLSLGWKPVPQLIDEVVDEATSSRRRAWLLGILYAITTYHDPREESGVLPDFRGEGRMVSNAKIDPAKQLEFARRWEGFRKYIVVRLVGPTCRA